MSAKVLVPIAALIAAGLVSAGTAQAAPLPAASYSNFPYTSAASGSSTLLTGIRSTGSANGQNVYMSGVYKPTAGGTQGLIYKGTLSGTGTWTTLNRPSTSGATTSNTALYGPDNIGKSGYRVVGSYKTQQTGGRDHGLIYTAPNGNSTGATWATLDATSLVASDDTLENTIAHSTRGGLVVGNFDTVLIQGRAFVATTKGTKWVEITAPGAVSTTAYGIWQDAPGAYTIAGGYFERLGSGSLVEHAYLVHYASATQKFSGWRTYDFDNRTSRVHITHFDGITPDGNGGYNLTGDWIGAGAGVKGIGFFAHVGVSKSGAFGQASWQQVKFPKSAVTSGNSVYERNVIGVYVNSGSKVVHPYLAAIPG